MGYQFLPPLSDDERKALRESIETFGVLHQVVTDEDGTIIDGHHRAEVAAELGIEYSTTVLPGLSEEEKIETALTLNLGRRHLDLEEKRVLVADLRERGLSVRWISEKTGIPKSTVHRYSRRVPGGTPEYVGGRDGKTYRSVRTDNPIDLWRREVAELCGHSVPATPDELRHLTLNDFYMDFQHTAFTYDGPKLSDSDLDWNMIYLFYLGHVASRFYLITGPDTMPRHPTLSDLDWEKVGRLGDVATGDFLNWADTHSMLSDDRILKPDSDTFQACECGECQLMRDEFADRHDNPAHVMAVGRWGMMVIDRHELHEAFSAAG